MNILVNPGFDEVPPWGGWNNSPTGTAIITDGSARSLPNCARVGASYLQTVPIPPTFELIEGWFRQDFVPRANQLYAVSVLVKSVYVWGALTLSVSGEEIARIDGDTDGQWVLLGGIWKAPSTATVAVEVKALRGTGTGISYWLVDDAEVAMARGGYIAYSALITTLRGITGSGAGYYTNVGSRVYPRLVRPESGMKLPYICVVPDADQPVSEDHSTYLMARWRFRITAFLAGSESMVETTSTAKAVLDAYDDMLRAVKPYSHANQPLSSAAVSDVSEVGKELFGGVPDGYSYGEASLIVDVSVPLTADNLGPGGV